MSSACTGERKPQGYVGSAIQADDLKVSGVRLMQAFQAFDQPSLLGTVKLHHVLAHAPADILAHGHEKHYSAQVWWIKPVLRLSERDLCHLMFKECAVIAQGTPFLTFMTCERVLEISSQLHILITLL